jgi:hypothetical protein
MGGDITMYFRTAAGFVSIALVGATASIRKPDGCPESNRVNPDGD